MAQKDITWPGLRVSFFTTGSDGFLFYAEAKSLGKNYSTNFGDILQLNIKEPTIEWVF